MLRTEPSELFILKQEYNEKLTWRFDSINARTTEEEVARFYSPENLLTIEGPKGTMILFDGNILHAGGYVKRGSRTVVYMEAF
jgi:hypothetical protein